MLLKGKLKYSPNGLALAVVLGLTLSLAGCGVSSNYVEQNLEAIGQPSLDEFAPPSENLFKSIASQPTNSRLHFTNGLYFYNRPGVSNLELAKVAFAESNRYAADWWQPLLGLAATNYRLGEFDDSLKYYVDAVRLRGSCDGLCYGLALVAFRAGYYNLAASAHEGARQLGAPLTKVEISADEFLTAAFSSTDMRTRRVEEVRAATKTFYSLKVASTDQDQMPESVNDRFAKPESSPSFPRSDEEPPAAPEGGNVGGKMFSLDSIPDTSSGPSNEGGNGNDGTNEDGFSLAAKDGSNNVMINAYVIKHTRKASVSSGIDLMTALQMQFEGTIVNVEGMYTDDKQVSGGLQVSIPTITYAMNVASENIVNASVEASPSIIGMIGEESRFFDGSSVTIMPQGNDRDNIDADVGVDLKTTPKAINAEGAVVSASMELSSIAPTTVPGDVSVFQKKKTVASATARIPYGKAMVLGSGTSTATDQGSSGTIGARNLPIAGILFGTEVGSVTREDVIVLVTVNKNNLNDKMPKIDEAKIIKSLFSATQRSVRYLSRMPSEVPQVNILGDGTLD